jgi:hypothetical protein
MVHNIIIESYFKQKEILRISSPDGKVDAVIIEVNGGATNDLILDVFVVPKGKSIVSKMDDCYWRVLQGRFSQNLNIKWATPKLLEISNAFGYVDYFKNNLSFSIEPDLPVYEVDIGMKD